MSAVARHFVFRLIELSREHDFTDHDMVSEITHALFVAWQQPDTRRFHPNARLARVSEGACEHCFEFAYIQEELQAQGDGFQPFLAFPNLNEAERSRSFFPTFANRIMSESRMEYPLYLERLGLGSDMADPFDILGRSGGSRTPAEDQRGRGSFLTCYAAFERVIARALEK